MANKPAASSTMNRKEIGVTRVNISVETAYLVPLCASQVSYFFPKQFEFCTSQMHRNASKSSRYVEILWLIDR